MDLLFIKAQLLIIYFILYSNIDNSLISIKIEAINKSTYSQNTGTVGSINYIKLKVYNNSNYNLFVPFDSLQCVYQKNFKNDSVGILGKSTMINPILLISGKDNRYLFPYVRFISWGDTFTYKKYQLYEEVSIDDLFKNQIARGLYIKTNDSIVTTVKYNLPNITDGIYNGYVWPEDGIVFVQIGLVCKKKSFEHYLGKKLNKILRDGLNYKLWKGEVVSNKISLMPKGD